MSVSSGADTSHRPAPRGCWALAVAGLAALLFLTRLILLPRLPDWLTARDPALRSDLAIALGGDSSGSREAGAARLFHAGRVAAILCSGRDLLWHVNEADAMAAHARALGVPASRILRSRSGESTALEAAQILPIVRRHGVRSVLLVTTALHSRRARAIFRRAWRGAGVRILSCPVESPYFRRERWWSRVRDREVVQVELLSWARVLVGH